MRLSYVSRRFIPKITVSNFVTSIQAVSVGLNFKYCQYHLNTLNINSNPMKYTGRCMHLVIR